MPDRPLRGCSRPKDECEQASVLKAKAWLRKREVRDSTLGPRHPGRPFSKLSKKFDRLVEQGLVEDSEANRREFIAQMVQAKKGRKNPKTPAGKMPWVQVLSSAFETNRKHH